MTPQRCRRANFQFLQVCRKDTDDPDSTHTAKNPLHLYDIGGVSAAA